MNPQSYLEPLTVRFWQTDSAGIMFFANAFQLAHDVYENFVTVALGVPAKDWFNHPEWAVPVRHAEADYFKPLRPHERYEAKLRLESVSESSFTLKTLITSKEGSHCAVTTVHVFLDKNTGTKLKIPAEIRSRLLAYQGENL